MWVPTLVLILFCCIQTCTAEDLPAGLDNSFNEFLNAGLESAPATGIVQRCDGCGAPGNVGPVLVLYITFQGQTPTKSLQQLKEMLFGVPGVADIFKFSSWGQTILAQSNVDFLEMEADTDPSLWGDSTLSNVLQQSAYQSYKNSNGKDYQFEMTIKPGTHNEAYALLLGKYSVYQHEMITWQTFSHELGHNFGLDHSGGYFQGQDFRMYGDDALMGYQRSWREGDFNVVARYNLGWIPVSQTTSAVETFSARLRALNEGPQNDGSKLIMSIPCSTCVSSASAIGGTLFLSFRVQDPEHSYGVDLENTLHEKVTDRVLSLVDHVHIHFQGTGKRSTELWSTIGLSGTYDVPDANIWVHVCKIQTATGSSEFADVGVSVESAQQAIDKCAENNGNNLNNDNVVGVSSTITLTTTTATMAATVDNDNSLNNGNVGGVAPTTTTTTAQVRTYDFFGTEMEVPSWVPDEIAGIKLLDVPATYYAGGLALVLLFFCGCLCCCCCCGGGGGKGKGRALHVAPHEAPHEPMAPVSAHALPRDGEHSPLLSEPHAQQRPPQHKQEGFAAWVARCCSRRT